MPSRTSGAPLVILSTVLFIAVLLIYTHFLGGYEKPLQLEILLYGTGRISVVLFLLIYLGSPLKKFNLYLGRFIVEHRRQLGISVGISHFVHLCCLGLYLTQETYAKPDLIFLTFGAVGLPIMALMVLTSNDYSVRLLRVGWKLLHKIGLYYLWLTFMLIYQNKATGGDPFSAVILFLLLGAAALRLGLYLFKPIPIR